MSETTFKIAIDGPVAAGKGTTARILADRLGFLYVDTGALYRAITLLSVREGIDWSDGEKVVAMLEKKKPRIELLIPQGECKDGRLCTVLLNSEDVSWKIRTEEISRATSPVAQYGPVRDYVNEIARNLAKEQDVVMEGRDITGVVLPDAKLKIYMDADPMERAKRRHRELLTRGQDLSLDQVYKDLLERDKRDMEKNLKKLPGVWVLDTTGMTIDQVANLIVEKVEKMRRPSGQET